jgi:16S rRNA (guanine527-N7)-methyltransferase
MLAMNMNSNSLLQNVSRETFSVLSDYVSLILKWNATINLIGPTTEASIWERHIADSIQLAEFLPPTATSLVDLGSGAGLPGMVLAIARPDLAVTLVDQDQRKCAFLTEVKSRLRMDNVFIVNKAIEQVNDRFDVVTARALAPLLDLLALATPRLKAEGLALFLKGQGAGEELLQARSQWQFEANLFPSLTANGGQILAIRGLIKNNSKSSH